MTSNMITCPVCGKELDLRDTDQIIGHMVIDDEHIAHTEKTKVKMMLDQLMPHEGMPN